MLDVCAVALAQVKWWTHVLIHGERQLLTVEEPTIGASMVTGVHAQVTVYVKESRAADHSQSMAKCCRWPSFTAVATSARRLHVGPVKCVKRFREPICATSGKFRYCQRHIQMLCVSLLTAICVVTIAVPTVIVSSVANASIEMTVELI
jgi:hypothetical protein